MQYAIYSFLFQFILSGFNFVHAIIGQNIRPAEENEFPSVVCIMRYDADNTWQENMQCTGTLISHNYILTAAHCFDNANETKIEVFANSHLITQSIKYYPVWWITYDQWAIRHVPNFEVPTLINDIMLAKIFGIWRDIPLSQLGPITPPSLMYGIDTTIVGCGKINNGRFPEVIHATTVKIIDLQTCMDIISNLQGRGIIIDEDYSCSIAEPYAQVSEGDSGGPLMYYGLIIGINIAVCPRMNDEFNPNKVNVHVNLNKYGEFINNLVVPDSQDSR